MVELRRIASEGTHETEIRKSRFVCRVGRVESEDQARAFVADVRKRHWQASHNCMAYIVGDQGNIQRSNDDGEPSGTAGLPMLEVLRKMHLTDTVAIVTRYFGGTLLGTGGLIRAYGGAVSETIRLTGVVHRRILNVVEMEANHAEAGRIHNALAASAFPEATVTYCAEQVRFVIHLEETDLDPFKTWVAETSNGTILPQTLDQTGIDVACDLDLPKES